MRSSLWIYVMILNHKITTVVALKIGYAVIAVKMDIAQINHLNFSSEASKPIVVRLLCRTVPVVK